MNISRFLQTVKWTELTLLRRTLRYTIGLAIFFFLFTIITTRGFEGFSDVDGIDTACIECLFISVALLIFRAAYILSDAKRNQDRIFLLMLPASNAEKFWARVLHITVVNALICLVAILIADALQMLVCLALGGPTASLTASVFSGYSIAVAINEHDYAVMGVVLFVLSLVWLQSLYLLGGTFFRKSQWITTSLVLVLGSIVLSAITAYGGVQLADSNALDDYVLDVYGTAYLTMAVFAVFIVLNYWLAYKLFTRLQLINNKWCNL